MTPEDITRHAAIEMPANKVARFRQLNMDRPNVHHDALEFPDGQIVLGPASRSHRRRR